MQTDVRVVNETATPAGATLSLEALERDKQPIAGTVTVVKEHGAWKVGTAVERRQPKRSGTRNPTTAAATSSLSHPRSAPAR